MNNTIFDDVFRTFVYKMPQLVVPLINEAFGTDYPDDVKIERLQNESFGSNAEDERITDTYLKIAGHIYHIECQSNEDGVMILRMIEYDFRIALDSASETDELVTVRFPKSFILYLWGTAKRKNKDSHELKARVIFPNDAELTYTVPRINLSDYDRDEIFKKKLIMLLPFYILKYEKSFKYIEKDEAKLNAVLDDYKEIAERLYNTLDEKDRGILYGDLVNYINKIADYLLEKHEMIRKEVRGVMGGHILELESERLIRIGKEKGQEEERVNTERERLRADDAQRRENLERKRADLAEARVKELEKEVARLKA